METGKILVGVVGVVVVIAGAVTVIINPDLLNKFKFSNKNQKEKSIKQEKIDSDDLSNYIKIVYSKIIDWNNNLNLQSIYEAGEKDFAKKLLEKIDNKEEFLKIFNSDFTNEALEKVSLDEKYNILEKKGDVPINLMVKFKDFNITEGTLTDKIEKLMIEWYKDGVKYVKNKIKYDVESENWDRVKFLLEKI